MPRHTSRKREVCFHRCRHELSNHERRLVHARELRTHEGSTTRASNRSASGAGKRHIFEAPAKETMGDRSAEAKRTQTADHESTLLPRLLQAPRLIIAASISTHGHSECHLARGRAQERHEMRVRTARGATRSSRRQNYHPHPCRPDRLKKLTAAAVRSLPRLPQPTVPPRATPDPPPLRMPPNAPCSP